MNFNTFFLDKLSPGGQSVNTSHGKNALSSYLFSDIMKVYEKEGRTTQKSRPGSDVSISDTKEKLPVPVNVIKCNQKRIKTLSRFLDSFTRNSKEPINTSESKHDLKPVVIKKKQFLLSSSGIEEFLKGVVESTDLNYAVDIKKNISAEEDNSKEIVSIDAAHESNSKLETPSADDSSEADASEKIAANVEEILQSILNFISNNKSMSLSFKSDFEKVNINIYALPEDNFETKINLEKLASDFLSTGKNTGEEAVDFSNQVMSDEQISQLLTDIPENKPAEFLTSPSEVAEQSTVGIQQDLSNRGLSLKQAGFNATSYENIYKTEITEIAYKPSLAQINSEEDVQQKAEKTTLDPGLVSKANTEKTAIIEIVYKPALAYISSDEDVQQKVEKAPLGPVLDSKANTYKTEITEIAYKPSLAQISSDEDVQLKAEKVALDPGLVSKANNEKTAIPDAKFRLTSNLSTQLSIDVNADETIPSKSVEKSEEGLSTKNLLNQLNGKLVSVELKKSADNTNSAVREPGTKQINGQGAEQKIISSGFEDSKNQVAQFSNNPKDSEFRNAIDTKAPTNSELGTKPVPAQNDGQSIVKGDAEDLKYRSSTFNNNKPADSAPEKANAGSTPKNHETVSKSSTSQTPVQPAVVSGNEESQNQFAELNGKLLGVDLKKAAGKNETNQNTSEIEGVKSASGEHAKMNELSGVKADAKTSDGKDSEKHKPSDGFKTILQGTEPVKSGPEVFKITPEFKNSPEVPKTIKTSEIIPEFSKMLHGGEKQSMTFQLTPENLGKVKLIVELVDSKIVSRIEVENEQVKQFIQSNVEQLKQNLQNSGIQLSSVNISLTESEQKYSKAASHRKKMGEKVSKVKEVDERTRPAQKSLGYNTYEFLA